MPTGHPGKLNIMKRYGRGNWHLIPFALNRYCIEASRALPTCLQPVSTSQLTFRALCEFLTAVSLKTTIFWNVTPCSLIQTRWHFTANCCFRLQYRGIKTLEKEKKAADYSETSSIFFNALYAKRHNLRISAPLLFSSVQTPQFVELSLISSAVILFRPHHV